MLLVFGDQAGSLHIEDKKKTGLPSGAQYCDRKAVAKPEKKSTNFVGIGPELINL